ncbi:hypothetical protein GO495_31500 [Chitinophaga oryziterrae]|uniref:Uncharacterized protein n=1 Tax=Chitinophaga oryziterrae TaxID=1031224 RepID=A0A6N8JLA2_9BACT|nr:hypothetical protein [Chitinophaga oryziterrae]MVT45156.1 hypothetical protein [Chitinophaga oryziterrae]
MFSEVIDIINNKVKDLYFFEFSVLSLQKETLLVAGSKDFIYYHNFEIVFNDVYAILGTLNWQIIPGKLCLELISDEAAKELNMGYWIQQDLSIFKFNCEDTLPTYIVAKTIELKDEIVYH